jgi:ribonuclease D
MTIYKAEISKEELQQLPHIQFDGKIHIINHPIEAEKAAQYLQQYKYLGFDTETRPSFTKGQINKVALLQLATNDNAFLFRLNHFTLTKGLIKILSNPEIIKAGAAIHDDIKVLQHNNKFKPAGFVELQDEAPRRGINGLSLKKLAGIVLNGRISKAQQLSNWEAPELTEAQQLYAATDAWISFKIYEDFLKNDNN